MKKRLLAMTTFLMLALTAGCGEERAPEKTANGMVGERAMSVESNGRMQSTDSATVSPANIKVMLQPEKPVAGDCLQAIIEGKTSARVFVWTVNDREVQRGASNRYCLDDNRRDDVIAVHVGTPASGGAAAVTVANSPPRVIDTSIEMFRDGNDAYLVVLPKVVDADEDYVSLGYIWIVNGEVNESYTDNRLPATAFHQGDAVEIQIVLEDPFGKAPVYQTRKFNVPGVEPFITSRPPLAFETMEYRYQIDATDPDGGALSFSLAEAPDGMTIDTETGAIIWPLETVEPGVYQVKIVVADPEGNIANQDFTLRLGERTVE
jgi:hypothetical protein